MLIRSLMTSAIFLGAPFLDVNPVVAQQAKQAKAANNDEILTYVNMSIAAFCEARNQKVDFKKSMGIAISVQAYPIFSKHGGLVPNAKKPLDEKQFIPGAWMMIMSGSLNLCPKSVPAAEKKRFEDALEKKPSR